MPFNEGLKKYRGDAAVYGVSSRGRTPGRWQESPRRYDRGSTCLDCRRVLPFDRVIWTSQNVYVSTPFVLLQRCCLLKYFAIGPYYLFVRPGTAPGRLTKTGGVGNRGEIGGGGDRLTEGVDGK